MAKIQHYFGEYLTQSESSAANNITSSLPAPGAGRAWVIDSLSFYGNAAITSWSVEVTESGGASCFKAGATTAAYPPPIQGPICTKPNDTPSVVLAAAGTTACQINIIARLVAAAT